MAKRYLSLRHPSTLETSLSKGIIAFSLLVILFQRILMFKVYNPTVVRFTFFTDILQATGIFINTLILILYNKRRPTKFAYGALTVSLNFPFTVLSGMFNAFFHLNFEYIIIVMLIEILIRMLLTLNNWEFAYCNLISSLTLVFFLFIYFSICHIRLNSGVKSYLLVTIVAHLCLCIFSVFFYKSRKENEFLKIDLINHNKNLKELFDNLKVGILRTTSTKRLLINSVARLFLEQLKVNSITSCLSQVDYYPEIEDKLSGQEDLFQAFSDNFVHNSFIPLGQIASPDSFFEISVRIYSNNKKIRFFEFTIQDVGYAVRAKKKETEQSLKGLFLSKMAHEVKNPLMNVKQLALELNSLFYRCRFDLDLLRQTEFSSDLDKIMVYSDNLVNILDDFSVFSNENLETIKSSQQCSLRGILSNLVCLTNKNIEIANKEGLFVEMEFDPECKRIFSLNPRILRQIMLNLLKNAVKATNNGKILVEVVLLSEERSIQEIKITVEDSGCGMSENKARELQSGEFSDDCRLYVEKGSQMGIMIVHKLLKVLKSSLSVKSKQGKGSRFSFILKLEAVGEADSSAEGSTYSNLVDETRRDNAPFDANDFKKTTRLNGKSCIWLNS